MARTFKPVGASQHVEALTLTLRYDDIIKDVAGGTHDLKTASANFVAPIAKLPHLARIIGYAAAADTPFTVGGGSGAGSTILTLASDASGTAIGTAIQAGGQALLPGVSLGDDATLYLKVTSGTTAATAGKTSLTVLFVVPGRANEVTG
ncbi:MAG: hypothetical protein LBC97_15805 [Bifidobacteriaceae bacterium]|jgi:hypothetical protein|nr:hypothetical protein [Bifidobacteriaceae bacterium]